MNSFWKHFFLDNGDISLIEAGVQKYVPNQINNYKVKHELVFHIVLQGKGYYTVEDTTYDLSSNDIFILKKNQRVYYLPDSDNPWTICWIGIGGKNLDKYLRETMIPENNVLSSHDNSQLIEEMKQFIYFLSLSNSNDTQDFLTTFSLLYRILSLINKEFPLKNHIDNGYNLAEPRLAEKIYEYIYAHFLHDVTVIDITEKFNISRNYVYKLCKDYYGQSPKQMIQELRMNQASQLLRGTNSQVKEIAAIVGYKDAFSFSKMFKDYYGHSPSQFRKLSEEEIDKALFIREEFLGGKVNYK